jgi:long-chain fatty acid transport protein
MRLAEWTHLRGALLAVPLVAVAAFVNASGFAIESQGARAMGFAGAYVAQAADASAIYYNPAGIGFLRGRQLYLTGAFATVSTDFTGSGPNPPEGTLEKSDNGLGVLPAAYYTQQVGDKTVIGVGFNLPFGFRSEWKNPDTFTGRFICLACEIRSWGINPTIAFKLADRLAVGAGVDIRLSNFKVSRRIQTEPPQTSDVAQLNFDSSTKVGVGFDVGLLASPSESLSIGVAYRHKVKIEHPAQADFIQILTGDQAVDAAVAAALPASQPGTATFTYPGSISAGIAIRHRYWTIEGDFEWTLWSSFDAVSLTFDNNPEFDVVLPEDWTSTWRGALGVEYLLSDTWEVRGGYSYDHSPAPTENLSPFIHDQDRDTFSVGGSWKYETLRLDFDARYVHFRVAPTFGVNRYDYNGTYKSDGLQFGVSLGYRF